jgi:YD repeat-containing protein
VSDNKKNKEPRMGRANSKGGRCARAAQRAKLCVVVALSVLGFSVPSIPAGAASARDVLSYASAPPIRLFGDQGRDSGFYTTGDLACAAASPGRYRSGQYEIEYSNPRAGYHPNYGLGCYYKVVYYSSYDGRVMWEYPDWFGQNWIWIYQGCPAALPSYDAATDTCWMARPANDASCPVGNPIKPGLGYKLQVEVDYDERDRRPAGLSFTRQYASYHILPHQGLLGTDWFAAPYERSLTLKSDSRGSYILATRALGEVNGFTRTASGWASQQAPGDRLQEVILDDGSQGYRYEAAGSESAEFYDALGQLIKISTRAGHSHSLTYSTADTPPERAPKAGLLLAVHDSFGRALEFGYNAQGLLSRLTTPEGMLYGYEYESVRVGGRAAPQPHRGGLPQ